MAYKLVLADLDILCKARDPSAIYVAMLIG